MDEKYLWISAIVAILLIMLFFNRKVRLLALIKEQLLIFKNDKTKKTSIWDIVCFIGFPLIVALILVFKLNFTIDNDLATLLTTVFAIVFTVLFGFAAIMISKINSGNKVEKQVAEETFVSIVSSTILSLIAAVLSIILTHITTTTVVQTDFTILIQILSVITIALSLIIIMLILMITKRTFYLYIRYK